MNHNAKTSSFKHVKWPIILLRLCVELKKKALVPSCIALVTQGVTRLSRVERVAETTLKKKSLRHIIFKQESIGVAQWLKNYCASIALLSLAHTVSCLDQVFKRCSNCSSCSRCSTGDRKQFQNLNILLNNKTGLLFLEFNSC